MSGLIPLDTDPGLHAFGHDPVWLVIVKSVLIFLILVLLTLFNIWFERALSPGCSTGSAPTCTDRSGCCSRWPTA